MPAAKSDLVRLRHILESAQKAIRFSKGKTRGDLGKDEQLTLALVQLLEIMGEAATKVTTETQNRFPTIPWRAIIGTRNRLIHGYDQINLDILWAVISDDLPPLVTELQRIIDEAEQQRKLS
jgi:uncharacterized protein with HEPN domain